MHQTGHGDSVSMPRNITIHEHGIEACKIPEQVLVPTSKRLQVEFIDDEQFVVSLLWPPKRVGPVLMQISRDQPYITYFNYTLDQGYDFPPQCWPTKIVKHQNIFLEPWKISDGQLAHLTGMHNIFFWRLVDTLVSGGLGNKTSVIGIPSMVTTILFIDDAYSV